MYAEQQLNAFEMVVELRLTVEITLGYRKDFDTQKLIVSAKEIESGIKKLIDHSDGIRKRVKTSSAAATKALSSCKVGLWRDYSSK